ncbi:hypothetical protein ACE6H2_016955 [Prunus campanulata]
MLLALTTLKFRHLHLAAEVHNSGGREVKVATKASPAATATREAITLHYLPEKERKKEALGFCIIVHFQLN